MHKGYLAMVLHAHLPYVRHPEHDNFLEERWLFEAITECYIPLLSVIEGLEDDGVDYGLLVSLSPTLVTMFEDDLLQERYSRHLNNLISLAEQEAKRTATDRVFGPLARFYADFFRDIRHWYEERYERKIAAAFRRLAAMGRLELMTCAATHGFLPLLKTNTAAVRAQVATAVAYHQTVFGAPPEGMWIPECAWYPGLDEILAAHGIRYFFVDAHAFENADERPKFHVYAPAYTPAGVAVFGRDKETSYQVWSAECGYPGHGDYREFYRDIGYDLPEEMVRDFLIDGRIRTNTGIKYYRITKRGSNHKEPYDPQRARERAAEHAGNFMFNREKQVEYWANRMDRPPLVVAMYDAELFGHWWFEGPRFLDYVMRKICYDQQTVKTITPRRYLQLFPANQRLTPAGSSWGSGGTYEYWINPSNDGMLQDLHRAADRLSQRARENGLHSETTSSRPGDRQIYRLLQQMMRELMLAQASDWPFIIRTGTSPDYARFRIQSHLSRFWTLDNMLTAGKIDHAKLQAVEFVDNIFPDIKPEIYAS